jgi:protein O-mannosyl-transferase
MPSSSARSRKTMISDPGKDVRIVIAAALGALWFALHPLQVEPVAWVSGLKDVLCGTFSLLSLLLFLMSGHDRANRVPLRFLGSLALMALAVLSKPSAIILPLLGYVLSLLIAYPAKRVRWMGRAGIAVLVVSVPALFVTSAAQSMPEGNFVAPLWARPLVALDALAFYLYKTVFPVGLTLSYGRTPRAVLATHVWAYWTWMLPAALTLALALAWWKNRRPFGLAWVSLIGLLFFCLGFFPVLGLVPFGYQTLSTVSDRYAYLSLLGPALILSFVVSRVLGPKRVMFVAGGVMLCIAGLGVMSYRQGTYWHDTLAVAERMLEVAPNNGMSQSTAGEAKMAAGELDAAAGHLERALQLCEPSRVADYSFELGLGRHLQGRISEAAGLYRKAIALNPFVPGAQNNLGVILMMQGNPAQAVSYFQAAIRFDPLRSAEPYFNLAKAVEQLPGQADKARALFAQALQLQPGIVQREHLLLQRLRQYQPGNVVFNTELRLMWPYGYPVPGSREGY